MTQYPITPDYLKAVPSEIEALFASYEDFLIRDICKTLKVTDNLPNEAAIQKLLDLKLKGYNTKKIMQKLAALTGQTEDVVKAAIDDAISQNAAYYAALYGATQTDAALLSAILPEVDAIEQQTIDTCKNLTQSFGFSIRRLDGSVQFFNPSDAYQEVLDQALFKVRQGSSYNEAIRSATIQLSNAGIEYIEYYKEAGPKHSHFNRADVAARRALMTGVTQISAQYAREAARDLKTDYVEVTAHSGARDVDGPAPWSNHKAWQGKVYSNRTGDIYPSVYEVCGLGEVDGLCGVNCRHLYHPFIPGVMTRTWTDKELAHIDREDIQYNGKHYSQYEAQQTMRKAETKMRDLKRKMIASSAGGDKERYTAYAGKYNTLKSEYLNFAEQTGLRSQINRSSIIQWGTKEEIDAEKALNIT